MRLQAYLPAAVTSLFLLLPIFATALSIDCGDIKVDDRKFDFRTLDGRHTLYRLEEHPVTITNTTFSFNFCRPLGRLKGVPKEEDCPNGSRVCAIPRILNTVENSTVTGDPVPIAGEFSHSIGGALDPKFTRKKPSASPADGDKEGIRLEMRGGKDVNGKQQKAILDFICMIPEEAERENLSAAEDEKAASGEESDDGDGGKIKLLSWDDEDDEKVLRMEWDTNRACEDTQNGHSKSKSHSWGAFTWVIIIIFMGVASYLVFTSWISYSRNSARGWDLVPHSDTLRDIPYLFRDWVRRVIETVQGGGSRGGYSAV